MVSKGKAPGEGAKALAQHQPAILNYTPQGGGQVPDASVVRISRMLRGVIKNETKIQPWEAMGQAEGRRLSSVDGKLKWVKVSELVGDALDEAKHERTEHLAEARRVIDYYLTHVAYEDIPCPSCQLPAAALDFVRAVAEFEPPAIQCTTCLDVKAVRSKRLDDQSIEDFKLVTYWGKILNDLARCAKIKAGTSEANQAYIELEAANRNLLVKFGNEKQTSLEGDDALQGVRQGIIDAAIRFDPLKKKNGKYCCAAFNTVAYNWCRRNSRARHRGQKRAGVYAPSIDVDNGEETSMAAMIVESAGALGVMSGKVPTAHCGDRCSLCGDVSAVDPETWQSTGFCEPCDAIAKKKKKAKPMGSAFAAGGRSVASPTLVLDMRDQLDSLPELQGSVVGFELDGMSTAWISDRLQISRVAVRKHRFAAFETLRETMTGYGQVSVLHD